MALLNKLFPSSTTSSSLASAWKTPSSSSSSSTSSAISGAGNSTTIPASTAKATANSKRHNNNQSVISKNYLSQFPFDGRQIRVLLYKEEAERRLLFDSNALEKVPLKETNGNVMTKAARFDDKSTMSSSMANHNSSKIALLINKQQQLRSGKRHSHNFIEVCEEYGYRHNRPDSADITSVGEMVFGASAVSFRGTALKVHWLQDPSRILCSQVFLTPIAQSMAIGGSHSPYSTISANSLATPRTSISSEHGSIDGLSMNSFSMSFSVNVGRHLSLTPSGDRFSMAAVSSPLDVPDQQSLSANSDSIRSGSGPRYSSTYSNATDSGYSGISRSQVSSDQWSSASYQYSTRSSLGSVMSEQLDPLRKFSIDFTTVSSSYGGNVASDGNLQRRISRNLLTSFENEHAKNDWIGFINDNVAMSTTTTTATTNGGGSEGGNMGVPNYRRASYSANESRSNPEMGRRRGEAATMRTMSRRAKLGLAVCITMSESFEEEMELFCSEHIALLESMLSRLRARTERAYINHKDFLQIMYHAWQDTQQWFNDLFTAPRIKCPIWLSITTSGSKYSKSVAERFMKELGWLLSFADTKKTNFFISTMLTAILTHHLGWVSTVAAFNSSSSRSETSVAAIEQRAKLLQVSQKHPYNALWAQMGDLYGAIGLPPKLARTVVYGTEKLPVERLLNILTYFIRCGEVRRSAKREDFNKELINTIVSQKKNETIKKSSPNNSYSNKYSSGIKKAIIAGGGLTRTQTCKQNLNTISDNYAELSSSSSEEPEPNEVELVSTLKKNEIPNVFAFRDSRFVQQELRIGNYLMDTGIEKKSLLQQQNTNQSQSSGSGKDGRIRLTVTTPDNVEMCVEDENASSVEDCAVEAIEIDMGDSDALVSSETKTAAVRSHNIKKHFFWNMVPESVREGLSLTDVHKNGGRLLDRRSSSYSNESGIDGEDYADEENRPLLKRISHLSLSDLITQNSMGKGDRMTWGIEPIKENVSLEEQIHFDFCQKLIEREHGICLNNTGNENSGGDSANDGNGVVFVLGENEPLVNLKKSTEDLIVELSLDSNKQQKQQHALCPLHQGTRNAGSSKKHSGVKFNFEQYPQIATNYMRSKNLVMSNYELLMDKATKLEADEASHSQKSLFPTSTTSATVKKLPSSNTTTELPSTVAASTECLACNCMLNAYQTPSNATELEFETDEVRYSSTSLALSDGGRALHTVSSAASIDTLKSSAVANSGNDASLTTTSVTQQEQGEVDPTSSSSASIISVKKTPTFSGNTKKFSSHRGSISSVAAKCAAANEALHLIKLPVPAIKEVPQEDEPPGDMKLRAGFIPSLFLNVSDHYISDMVLQGTCASPTKWEANLREDLALAAHSASLISLPAENVAIVADMEKWDVSLISSQSQCFPYAGGQSTPVGMSQLVSSMLETVQAMSSAGISAYECLSYLESKMQEIYLQSESLAAFLLETEEFFSLNDVTKALNLSDNDVPLLLSIASIHTPQIGKKYGISFR